MTNGSLARAGSSPLPSAQDLRQSLAQSSAQLVLPGGMDILRLLQDGNWVYGAEDTEVDPDSIWAINPYAIEHGYICWSDDEKNAEVLGEQMAPITAPRPALATLPQHVNSRRGWEEQYSMVMKCIHGRDKDATVVYKVTSHGGKSAYQEYINFLIPRLDEDPPHIAALVMLDTESYKHKKYGKTYKPLLIYHEWLTLDQLEAHGGLPAAKAASAAVSGGPTAKAPKEIEATETDAPQRQRPADRKKSSPPPSFGGAASTPEPEPEPEPEPGPEHESKPPQRSGVPSFGGEAAAQTESADRPATGAVRRRRRSG